MERLADNIWVTFTLKDGWIEGFQVFDENPAIVKDAKRSSEQDRDAVWDTISNDLGQLCGFVAIPKTGAFQVLLRGRMSLLFSPDGDLKPAFKITGIFF